MKEWSGVEVKKSFLLTIQFIVIIYLSCSKVQVSVKLKKKNYYTIQYDFQRLFFPSI